MHMHAAGCPWRYWWHAAALGPIVELGDLSPGYSGLWPSGTLWATKLVDPPELPNQGECDFVIGVGFALAA